MERAGGDCKNMQMDVKICAMVDLHKNYAKKKTNSPICMNL